MSQGCHIYLAEGDKDKSIFRPGDCPPAGDEETGYPRTKQRSFIPEEDQKGAFLWRQADGILRLRPDPASGYAAVTLAFVPGIP
jgi:hypothetical protein